MNLLLDLGNTRLKAARYSGAGEISLLGEVRHRDDGVAAALAALLDGGDCAGIRKVICANVAGESVGRALAHALNDVGLGKVTFLRAVREACGVRCAYSEPGRLGADRWAALLGARGLTDAACLVVDAGSALTIDAMAGGGRHLGGWILPGLEMMVNALEARTGDLAALRRASFPGTGAGFPTDSGPAMDEGARLAVLGAVGLARSRLESHVHAATRLFLSGGDARVLRDALPDAEFVPELVLMGLARAAG